MIRMKSRMILFTLCMLGISMVAQAEERTLMGDRDWDYGGMGGFTTGVTGFSGGIAVLGGWHGQWIINHKWGFGFTGYSFHATEDYTFGTNRYDLSGGGSSFEVEYYIQPDRMLHYTVALGVGGGHIEAERESDSHDFTDEFLFLHPRVNAELSVTSWFRAGAFGGYRIAHDVDLLDLDEGDVSGWTAGLQFKFGEF